MMRGKDADRTRRYTVHRRAKSTHNRTVTLHSEVGGRNVTDSDDNRQRRESSSIALVTCCFDHPSSN